MSAPEPPEQPEPLVGRGRRLIWAGGTVVALWFVADGLSGLWPGAGALARVLIAVAVVVVVLVVVLGVVFVVRRDRED